MMSVTPAELHQAVRKGDVMLLDVRGPAEFQSLHAAGARNLPLADIAAPGRLAGLRREGPTYVICKSGARSQMAIRALENMGFSGLYNVIGGTDAWAAAGLPVDGALAPRR